MTKIIMVLMLLVAVPAYADANKDEARKIVGTAVVSFNLGKYDDAATQYESAYSLVPDPALLFNIGQCYRLADKPDKAAIAYRSYLRTSTENAPNRDLAEKRLGEMTSLISAREAALSTTSPPPVSPTPVVVKEPTVEDKKISPFMDEEVTSTPSPSPSPSPASQGGRSHTLVWVASAVTGVLAIAATTTMVVAHSRYTDLKNSCGVSGTCTDAQLHGVTSMSSTSNLLWIGTGVAAAGTGAAWYFTW